jgi:hypothetical protein
MNNRSFRQPVSDRLANDLGAFVRAAWPVLENQPLQWSWFHELICEYLTLCRRRVIKRFLLTIPPRMAKSTIVSVAFPCSAWIIDPQASFICASFGEVLATNLSVKRRTLMQSSFYQRMFPGRVSFASDQNQKTLYENTAGGRMYSVPMGGQVMGMGANYLILDDPMSPAISYSDVERENVLREISSTWRSRFNNPMDDVMIVVQQRVHANDPAGYFLRTEQGQWTHLNLPMIAEREETITFPISGRTMFRPEGDLLHPVGLVRERAREGGSARLGGPVSTETGAKRGSDFQERMVPHVPGTVPRQPGSRDSVVGYSLSDWPAIGP